VSLLDCRDMSGIMYGLEDVFAAHLTVFRVEINEKKEIWEYLEAWGSC
jgi:hypothetical protein